MRKILLYLFFLGFISTAFATPQFQVFTNEGGKIISGSRIKVQLLPEESYHQMHLLFEGMIDFKEWKVNQRVINSLPGTDHYYYFEKKKRKKKQNTGSTDFILEYIPNNQNGGFVVEYIIENIQTGTIAFRFEVEYTRSNNSLANERSFEVSEVYPNPVISDANFDFSFPIHYREAKIIIRSLLGSVVLQQSFEGTQGTLTMNLSDTPNGIYFYSIIIEGEIKETKKMIIKH